MLNLSRLAGFAQSLELTAYRSTSPKYANEQDLVTGEGSRQYGGRWNPPGIAAIYSSLTPETAMAEAIAHARYYGFPVQSIMPRTFVAISFKLQRVLDISDAKLRRKLGISKAKLVKTDWRAAKDAGQSPVTQAVGQAAFDAGIEALIVPSAVVPTERNLVVFPGCLLDGSSMTVLE
ncbi:MAG: RES family NAD+ phosphorylase [Planctomycetaceae bacterium]